MAAFDQLIDSITQFHEVKLPATQLSVLSSHQFHFEKLDIRSFLPGRSCPSYIYN